MKTGMGIYMKRLCKLFLLFLLGGIVLTACVANNNSEIFNNTFPVSSSETEKAEIASSANEESNSLFAAYHEQKLLEYFELYGYNTLYRTDFGQESFAPGKAAHELAVHAIFQITYKALLEQGNEIKTDANGTAFLSIADIQRAAHDFYGFELDLSQVKQLNTMNTSVAHSIGRDPFLMGDLAGALKIERIVPHGVNQISIFTSLCHLGYDGENAFYIAQKYEFEILKDYNLVPYRLLSIDAIE